MTLLSRRLRFAAWVVAAAALLSWLLQAESSPLRDYFLWHVSLPNVWALLNFPAVLVASALSGNVHQSGFGGYLAGIILQWGIVGYLLSLVFIREGR